jgi:glycosyltransferase involved in cell wall biosynthesis
MTWSGKSGGRKTRSKSDNYTGGARVRILSNVPSFGSANSVENYHYLGSYRNGFTRFTKLFLAAIRSYKYDVIFLNCAAFETLVLGLLKYFLPFNQSKIVTADLILRVPKTKWQWFLVFVKRLALKRIRLFILYHRDFSGYSKFYGIDRERVVYVPFKVNALELVGKQTPIEDEYIFSGGVSLRDWKTLALAMQGLDIPLVILSQNVEIDRKLPLEKMIQDNMRVVHDDGSGESWIRYIAEAKFVVLPISSDSIAASGISTYLVAMALKKCVIISEGPATQGILNRQNSVIVPPSDPDALRQAIQCVNANREFRQQVAEAGYRYAMSLGDTTRLYGDFISYILKVARDQNVEGAMDGYTSRSSKRFSRLSTGAERKSKERL